MFFRAGRPQESKIFVKAKGGDCLFLFQGVKYSTSAMMQNSGESDNNNILGSCSIFPSTTDSMIGSLTISAKISSRPAIIINWTIFSTE
jgi:hypothetical protein